MAGCSRDYVNQDLLRLKLLMTVSPLLLLLHHSDHDCVALLQGITGTLWPSRRRTT